MTRILAFALAFVFGIAHAGDNLPSLGTDQPKKDKPSYIPLVLGVAATVAVLSQWKPGTKLPCRDYPCADVAHVGTGAIVGYVVGKYYDAPTAYATMLAISVGKEAMDKHYGKRFSGRDIIGRMVGVPVGLYIYKEF